MFKHNESQQFKKIKDRVEMDQRIHYLINTSKVSYNEQKIYSLNNLFWARFSESINYERLNEKVFTIR
jgi:hypothetical protein